LTRAGWLTLLAACLPALGPPAGPAGAAAPSFVVETASGQTVRGPLEELRPGWSVRLGGGAAADVVTLRRAGEALPARPRGEQLVLANGDRLPVRITELAGERLRCRLAWQPSQEPPLEVPLSAVAVVWQAAPEGPEAEDAEKLLRRLGAGRRSRDVVLLRNGDTVEGILTGLSPKAVRLDLGKKKLDIDRGKVAAVALNTELLTAARPQGSYGRVVIKDGGRLSLASAAWAAGEPLTGVTLFRAPVKIPAADVAALYVLGGPAVYLSDLKPRRADYNSYGGDSWPFVADGSVDGHDLCLDGSTYDKGLGVHSETRLTYELAGRYRRFEALVGLDPRTGRRGRVRVQVLVDGKPQELGWDRELAGRDKPRPVRVDVGGARELTLAVEFGGGGPVQGHVNWADARLIK
jgi:hypothetical protein